MPIAPRVLRDRDWWFRRAAAGAVAKAKIEGSGGHYRRWWLREMRSRSARRTVSWLLSRGWRLLRKIRFCSQSWKRSSLRSGRKEKQCNRRRLKLRVEGLIKECDWSTRGREGRRRGGGNFETTIACPKAGDR
ncbi:protein PLASTID MOVEMENT IMPAIRED 1-RELATED 1-like [Iris pallida]|uniref:Protein PLASTID MOVEMENT IMPAIRED 1-RELATED 1-like n=1 Tax=Iris pallida TaxID=29817 RepID=A0AAX6HJ43_IRIPA|nr:protein PLASTID MOVEMENT IMPAIRED 1-RELATED 1-like [Iris pallida]